MATFIHRQGGRRTILDDDGHLRQFEEFGEPHAKISRETWANFASARKAFHGGNVHWEDDPSFPISLRDQ
jgi:hypothetical protein